MYLVELRPGKEELYRTGDELAAAIRSGDVDMHSRIYHRATSKWISVTLHPQYKAIISERPAAPPLPPLERSTWTFFNDSADSLAGANDPAPESAESKDDDPNHPWRRPLALSVTGGLLILGLQLAHSGPRPPWAETGTRGEADTEVMPAAALAAAPAAERAAPTVSLAASHAVSRPAWIEDGQRFVTASGGSSSAGDVAPAPAPAAPARAVPAPTTPAPAAPAPTAPAPRPAAAAPVPAADTASAASKPLLPAAPRLPRKTLLRDVTPAMAGAPAADARTVSGLVQRWTAAHDSARARLESGMRVVRLNQLFAPGRLSPGGGVTETRMSLAGVANFVRVYRQQQAAIEREYQDSFSVASREHGWSSTAVREWYTKPTLKEGPTLAALTTSLLEGIDSLFGVLDAQAGTYTVTRNTIRFEDPAAAREYAALRQRIMDTVESAKAVGGRDQQGPMSYLLQAIGPTRLPLAS